MVKSIIRRIKTIGASFPGYAHRYDKHYRNVLPRGLAIDRRKVTIVRTTVNAPKECRISVGDGSSFTDCDISMKDTSSLIIGKSVRLSGVRMAIGENCTVMIGDCSNLTACRFQLLGHDNRVACGTSCTVNTTDFWTEDDRSAIILHDRVYVTKKIQFAAIEGCSITVGSRTMLADGVRIRTGDSHSVLVGGTRANLSADVSIGEHCWLGEQAAILKGVSLAPGTIVGFRAVVTKSVDEPHTIIAGIPAKTIKRNVDWCGERI